MKRLVRATSQDVISTLQEMYNSTKDILFTAELTDVNSIKSAIKEAFDYASGVVSVRISSPTYIEYDGRVENYTIGGSVSTKNYTKGDLNRLAEDLTMATYRNMGNTNYTTMQLMDLIRSNTSVLSSTITAADTDKTELSRSTNGTFVLYKVNGIGMSNTPYTTYSVRSNKDTWVEVRLHLDNQNFNGEPVHYNVLSAEVCWCLPGHVITDVEVRKFIDDLEEALEFKQNCMFLLEDLGVVYHRG